MSRSSLSSPSSPESSSESKEYSEFSFRAILILEGLTALPVSRGLYSSYPQLNVSTFGRIRWVVSVYFSDKNG